jgi:hypothetical protein
MNRSRIASSRGAARWEPYAGIAFVVLFLAGVVVSNAPADNASDAKWIATYSTHGEQARHLATGLLLLLAGLSLLTFLTALARRIAIREPDRRFSGLPTAAAATAAACIAAGGMVMGYISGGELLGRYPLPSVDVLRLSNDLGFALAGIAGMWSAALAVGVLSVQGNTVGLFSGRMRVVGLVVSGVLVLSPLFVPIIALLVWVLLVAVMWIRRSDVDGSVVAIGEHAAA